MTALTVLLTLVTLDILEPESEFSCPNTKKIWQPFLGKWATMKTAWLWHIESVFSVMDANVVNEERKYTTDLSVFYQGFSV